MPIQRITGTDLEYSLIAFDERGRERREPDGTFLSETVRRRLVEGAPPVTDVFFMSHGWKGDVPAAIEQYDRWLGAMGAQTLDRDAARRQRPGFAPLIVGLHWPSLPWGDEALTPSKGLLSAGDDVEAEVDAFASRIADSPKARAAIRSILVAAQDPDADTLSAPILDAYATLFAESSLSAGDASGRPGSDQDGFDPATIIADARTSGMEAASPAPGLLGVGDKVRDALLMPLRQLSFWKMKDRARQVGESAAHPLLVQLQLAAPAARFHLMGHSFGCIVVSATVAGTASQVLPRPVDSLFLVQGALSLWAYADDIPYAPDTAGYFQKIVKQGLVRGPLVTTRSAHDTAVARLYPLGARLKKQLVLRDEYPKYGGIGAFGIQGVASAADIALQSATFRYDFRGGRIYNLDATDVIKNGGGASGAHNDIAHPEVAHAFWEAVLAGSMDSKGVLPADWVVKSPPVGSAVSEPPSVFRGGPAASAGTTRAAPRGGGGLLGAGPPAAPERREESARPRASETAAQPRWINAELEDHEAADPLAEGRWYTLAFDIDVEKHSRAVGAMRFSDEQLFPTGTEEVQLTVQLDSTDFEISDRTRPLRVARSGKSRTKARFDISPKHGGPSTITATFHKDGNFIQQMELGFDVGATAATEVQIKARGRPASAASLVHPRDIGLSLSPSNGGYDCVAWGVVSARAHLPLQPAYLASAIEAARREMLKVVMYRDAAGDYVFMQGVDIPDDAREFALKTLARAGALLFQKMFFGPAAGADSKVIGEFLRKMASDRATRLKLQIVAESTPVPWGLLYVGDASAAAKLDWDNFIGMRHVIEQIPLQTNLSVSEPVIPSNQPRLRVSTNVNTRIDADMASDFVAQQSAFWASATQSRRHVQVVARSTSQEVMRALADNKTEDQILYFYCHAESTGLTDPGGPDTSSLVLSDARITLGDLALDAPTTTQLPGNPLVFINACESAEMSPAFYDGFVPYFMAKGARGVVGTECKTPALFAVVWAKRFFERFLDGEALGDTFLGLRREFLEKHGNPLGLLYAVHCDGDTQIQPALAATG